MRLLVSLLLPLWLALPLSATEMGDDGLHKASWMRLDTFKDMTDDLAEANAEGKRLLILWEQRGCIYCTKMHKTVLSRPEIIDLIEQHYFVVQMNLFGDVEVTDFDGEALSERDMAMKWGVMFTPTFMFMPPEVDAGSVASKAAVATMPGAFEFETTFDLLNWIVEEGYLGDENFQKYHARKFNARKSGG